MEAIKQHLAHGELQQAIEVATQQIKANPGAADLRASLIELLCVAGQLERADEMLGALARHHPDWLAGAANLRQLIRSQQARLAFQQGQLADDVVATEGSDLEALLALRLHLTQNDLAAANTAAAKLEQAREPVSFRFGEVEGEIRDCDDSLCGFLEALGADGHYYLWRWSEIEAIDFHAPTSPVELVWRRADVELASGKQGEVFIPLTYVASQSDSELLGRVTDWQQQGDSLVTGTGLKLFLVGDEALGLDALKRVERVELADVD
ncbi:type VI secretion system accessory protein TagJ [Marinobacteraceae bacterium S3BR75-40.1]